MADLHLQHPEWLLALIPLALLLWWLQRDRGDNGGWKRVIDPRLQPLLLTGQGNGHRGSWLGLLGVGWLLAVVALADPAWDRQPQPVYQTDTARVIVLDLSRSMTIADLRPSRLARAKFKIRDMLALKQEGQTGLVVFAGDAFTVTPLTRDNDTIESLLDALDPSIMPVQGSRADLGLERAGQLLDQAGIAHGQIVLLADGADKRPAVAIAKKLQRQGHRVSVLGIGTETGGPVPGLRDRDGKPIIVPLQRETLLAIAKAGGGLYRDLGGDDSDIQALLHDTPGGLDADASRSNDARQEKWRSQGPWLVLLLLPIGALAFRRGWMLGLLLPLMVLQPSSGIASPLDGIFQRPDQRAARALNEGDYATAKKLATDPMTRGAAAYRAGDYDAALAAFSAASGADASYNRGNALAALGRYKEAISAYEEALRLEPEMTDAQINKKKIEALLKKQQQQNDSSAAKKDNRQQGGGDAEDQINRQASPSDQENGSENRRQDATNRNNSHNKNQEKKESNDNNKDQKTSPDQQKKGDDENQFAKAAEALKEKGEQKNESESLKPTDQSTAPRPKDDNATEKDEDTGAEPAQPRPEKNDDGDAEQRPAIADELTDEERLAAEQWLRRIPDDPGGLLRRKFQLQYQERAQPRPSGNPW